MAYAARARRNADLIQAYSRLEKHLRPYCTTRILSFDDSAAVHFQALKSAKLRIGTMDLRIAAIALAHGAMLLTRNVQDFLCVPGLKVEDWTV